MAAKEALACTTLLAYPKPNAPTSIMWNNSNMAVEAVPQQYIEDRWCAIAYLSKQSQSAQAQYRMFDKEFLAIYLSLKYFQHFIQGGQFSVYTDHKPLTYMYAHMSLNR